MKTLTAPSMSTWPRIVIAVGAATALLFAACSDAESDLTSTATVAATATATVEATQTATDVASPTTAVPEPPQMQGPPSVMASGGGVEGPLGVGTYCWTETGPGAGAGLCADAIGIITTPQVFVVPAGTTFEVTGFGEFQPTGGTALIWPNSIPSQSVGAFAQAWTPDVESSSLDVTVEGEGVSFVADLEPGTYVVGLSLLFPQGDVQYGLVIEVQ